MKAYHPILLAAIIFVTGINAAAQDAASFYNEGMALKKQGKTPEATAKFEKALSLNPDYTEARYEIGWCQNDSKDYSGAITTLRKVRGTWSAIPKVYFELGYAFEKTNQKDSAIRNYNKCLELKPDYSGAYKQLGYIAYSNDDHKLALENFSRYEQAAKDSIRDYWYWYKKGFSMNATKDYSGAIRALKKSATFKADYLHTWLELGFAAKKLKNDDDAIAYYGKAIALYPSDHIAYNGIGDVYRDNKKDMNEAMNWYKKALAINSTERKACFGMGYCLNSTGKYMEAIPYLKKAVEMEATYTAAFVELGYSYYKTSAYTDAIVNFNRAISLNEENENARYYLTLLFIEQKNKAKAQETLNGLKKLSSKYVAALQPRVDAL